MSSHRCITCPQLLWLLGHKKCTHHTSKYGKHYIYYILHHFTRISHRLKLYGLSRLRAIHKWDGDFLYFATRKTIRILLQHQECIPHEEAPWHRNVLAEKSPSKYCENTSCKPLHPYHNASSSTPPLLTMSCNQKPLPKLSSAPRSH